MIQKKWLVEFGMRLRTERERQKLTRIALANKVGSKQDYIAQLERGDKSPSMNTLIKILNALDVSADSLIFGVNQQKLDNVDGVLTELTDSLKRKSVEDILALCEIMKFLSDRVAVSKV